MKIIIQICYLSLAFLLFAACEKESQVSKENVSTAITTYLTDSTNTAKNKNVDTNSNSDEKRDWEEGTARYKNFIASYYDAEGFYAATYEKNVSEQRVIEVLMGGKRYDTGSSKYDAIAAQFGDTCYYGYNDPTYEVINDTIEAIDIICNEDFNEDHLQGTSLSDITSVVMSTPHKYLISGYFDETTQEERDSVFNYFATYHISFHDYYAVVYDKVQNIVPGSVKLFSPQIFVIFDDAPTQKGIYTFEISIKVSDKMLRRIVEVEF